MKAHFIILMHILSFAYCYSQSNMNAFYQEYFVKKMTVDAFLKNVDGSPYEKENFVESDVYLKGNDIPLKFSLRYNNLTDEMEMKDTTDHEYLVVNNNELIDSILMNNKIHVYLDFYQKNQLKKGFFFRLIAGKFALMQRRLRVYVPERKPTGGFQEYVRPSIQEKPVEYYLVQDKGYPELLPNTMFGIIRFLKAKGIDLNDHPELKKLKYKEEDIIKLFEYLNNK